MKKVLILTVMMFILISSISVVHAEDVLVINEQNEINNTQSEIKELKETIDNKLENYYKTYGNKSYAWVAFVLNTLRIYSIPICFIGIVISAIYQYIIGLKRLDLKEKGLYSMVGFITLLVLCQVLPLVFAIVVKGWNK